MGGSERATFLFTDIEDSCGLWERDTAGMEVDLEKHDRVLREAVESQGGRIFRSAGDSVLARFESAADAVQAAIDAQLRLRATIWGEATPIRVRMAVHDGEAQDRAGDFYGPALNRCARILGVAYGDQILVSRSVRDSVGNLSTATNLKPLGKVHLRGLEGPEEIYQVEHPGLKADFPPLAGLDTSPHNLPVQLTSFIGRNRDLREINKLLSASRIVTLTGPGGCGKTRLGLKLGEQVLEEFVDGVWFVELHALTNQDAVVGAVASVFSVAERTGQTIEEALAEWLQPKKALVIIDNCEHLLEGVSAFVGGMSAQCPNLKWVLTSRGPVHVHGEAIYRVPTLSVPDVDETRLASITRCAAVKLFTDRASVVSSFNLTSASAPHVASICRRLDGMPLAIEVAASWTKALAPRQIAERLGKHLDLLHRASPSKLSKHETLRAAIDWSYDLLVDQERRLFRQLAVFSGGWTLEAAEQVCRLEIDPIHVLASLIDKSLVMTEEGLAGELRYRYLETIREYALERFSETGDEADVRHRHLQYFMSFAHEAEEGMTGDAQAEWMSRLDLERGNLRAAMRSGLDLDETEPALKMAVSLWRYWYYHGQFSEGSKWLHDLLVGARHVTDDVRASAYNAIGVLALPQGDLDGAEKFHTQALALYKLLGDDRGTSAALHNLGMVASDRGDLDLARERYEQALEIARKLGDRARVAASLMNIGCVAYDSQRYAKARVPIEESLAIQRDLRNRWYVGKALALLGEIAVHLEDYEAAKAYLGECLPIFIDLSDTDGATLALVHLGIAAAKTGNEPTAVQLFSVVDRVRAGVERGIHPAIQETSRIAKQELARSLGRKEYQRLEAAGRTLDLRQAWLLAS